VGAAQTDRNMSQISVANHCLTSDDQWLASDTHGKTHHPAPRGLAAPEISTIEPDGQQTKLPTSRDQSARLSMSLSMNRSDAYPTMPGMPPLKPVFPAVEGLVGVRQRLCKAEVRGSIPLVSTHLNVPEFGPFIGRFGACIADLREKQFDQLV
jgi:hypothetical protein